jgi:hypothetical protein
VNDARSVASTRSAWLAALSLGLALAALAIDHLLGTERGESESGLADPTTFAVSVGLCLLAAVVVFGWLVPRARSRGPERAAAVGFIASVLSVVPGIAFLWLGFPFVVAGGGVALGLEGRRGGRRWLALAAVVVGAAMMAFGAVAYTVAAIDGISEL